VKLVDKESVNSLKESYRYSCIYRILDIVYWRVHLWRAWSWWVLSVLNVSTCVCRCWLSIETGLIWAFVVPALIIICVRSLLIVLYVCLSVCLSVCVCGCCCSVVLSCLCHFKSPCLSVAASYSYFYEIIAEKEIMNVGLSVMIIQTVADDFRWNFGRVGCVTSIF